MLPKQTLKWLRLQGPDFKLDPRADVPASLADEVLLGDAEDGDRGGDYDATVAAGSEVTPREVRARAAAADEVGGGEDAGWGGEDAQSEAREDAVSSVCVYVRCMCEVGRLRVLIRASVSRIVKGVREVVGSSAAQNRYIHWFSGQN